VEQAPVLQFIHNMEEVEVVLVEQEVREMLQEVQEEMVAQVFKFLQHLEIQFLH
jgi:hypothetical protein